MGALGSILGGLFLLLLGICGTIGVCSNCERNCQSDRHAKLVAQDNVVRAELDARVRRLLPARAGAWTLASVQESGPRSRLTWQAQYRGPGYDAEQAFQASPEGDAAFQEWSSALDRRIEALKARQASEIEAKAPQPQRYETVNALGAAQEQKLRGREGWNLQRLAAHRVVVYLEVFQKGGVTQTFWLNQATPLSTLPEGFVEGDRAALLGRTDGLDLRHRYRAGGWEGTGVVRTPAPTASLRAIQMSLTAAREENLQDFMRALDGKALVQSLQTP